MAVGLTAEWNHNDFSFVLGTKNLFVQNNKNYQLLSTNSYDLSRRTQCDIENAYASVKFLYTIEYGKKVRRSPKYKMKDSESTILR